SSDLVLNQMQKYGFITPSQYDSIKQLPIELEYSVASHNRGLVTYFREVVRADLTKWARENLKADGKPYDLYGDGLRIYTTIDSLLQRYSEVVDEEHMVFLQ